MDSMARMGVMGNKHTQSHKDMPPHAQMGVLFMVAINGPMSIKEISKRFGMTSSAATQLVNGLVKGGLLTREEDKDDRRKICVILTAKGKKIIEKAKEYRMKRMIEMFEPLSDTELGQLQKILTKIIEHWQTTCNKLQNK